ncbi:uncharacterized protein G2W53_019887 [Senna tora]|uniref:Uncharacterized protein n=1 Tax=Senna tora TaxID=362788 RepID=A0A834WPM1_9FABA|nr:uncharacterized protein G2W53_019887 [Senna tora]
MEGEVKRARAEYGSDRSQRITALFGAVFEVNWEVAAPYFQVLCYCWQKKRKRRRHTALLQAAFKKIGSNYQLQHDETDVEDSKKVLTDWMLTRYNVERQFHTMRESFEKESVGSGLHERCLVSNLSLSRSRGIQLNMISAKRTNLRYFSHVMRMKGEERPLCEANHRFFLFGETVQRQVNRPIPFPPIIFASKQTWFLAESKMTLLLM